MGICVPKANFVRWFQCEPMCLQYRRTRPALTKAQSSCRGVIGFANVNSRVPTHLPEHHRHECGALETERIACFLPTISSPLRGLPKYERMPLTRTLGGNNAGHNGALIGPSSFFPVISVTRRRECIKRCTMYVASAIKLGIQKRCRAGRQRIPLLATAPLRMEVIDPLIYHDLGDNQRHTNRRRFQLRRLNTPSDEGKLSTAKKTVALETNYGG